MGLGSHCSGGCRIPQTGAGGGGGVGSPPIIWRNIYKSCKKIKNGPRWGVRPGLPPPPDMGVILGVCLCIISDSVKLWGKRWCWHKHKCYMWSIFLSLILPQVLSLVFYFWLPDRARTCLLCLGVPVHLVNEGWRRECLRLQGLLLLPNKDK